MDQDRYIFPHEIIENTAEFHFHSHNSGTKVIYQAILVVLTCGFLALFLVKVDVNVKSDGLFRPISERNEIKSLVSGRIDSVFVSENRHLRAGEVLLTIKRESLEGKNDMVELQQHDIQEQLSDLSSLISASKNGNLSGRRQLKSGIYDQQYSYFLQRMVEARSRYSMAKKNYDRYLYLYARKAVSALEYEEVKLRLDNIRNELSLIGEDQSSRWQTELNGLKIQNREFNSQTRQYSENKEFYTLRAAVTGSVQQLKGIQPGSLVAANELIGEISPDSGMIAETYVLPRDIGLLRVGTKARFQVDAYNYNQWGMVSGRVVSISNDIFMDNGKALYFKVRCLLEQHQLQLKNGYIGKIKKGMTLRARFFVTRRTLFQLLYDKADDWLNPNVTSSNED